MPETVSDTGPILHLQEIGKLTTLAATDPLLLPNLVAEELEIHGFEATRLREVGISFAVQTVEPLIWRTILRDVAPQIQPADAQVFSLARDREFRALVLTDDLALRRLLEIHGSSVTGTVGILIRAYTLRSISRNEMERAFELLFDVSSLHLGRAFRTYLRHLLSNLP